MKWPHPTLEQNEKLEMFDDLVESLAAMDDLMDKLWKAVPWGKTFNLPIEELNEVPTRAKCLLNRARQGKGSSK